MSDSYDWEKDDKAILAQLEEERMRTYVDTIELPDYITLGTAQEALGKVREYGSGELNGNKLTMHYEQGDDWDLREVLADVQQELGAMGIDFHIDKSKVAD
jgi:hypothetical protein